MLLTKKLLKQKFSSMKQNKNIKFNHTAFPINTGDKPTNNYDQMIENDDIYDRMLHDQLKSYDNFYDKRRETDK